MKGSDEFEGQLNCTKDFISSLKKRHIFVNRVETNNMGNSE